MVDRVAPLNGAIANSDPAAPTTVEPLVEPTVGLREPVPAGLQPQAPQHVRIGTPGADVRARRRPTVTAAEIVSLYDRMRKRIAGDVGRAPPSPGVYALRMPDGGTSRVSAGLLPPLALRAGPVGELELGYVLRDDTSTPAGMYLQIAGRSYLARPTAQLTATPWRSDVEQLYRDARAAIDGRGLPARVIVEEATSSADGTQITTAGGIALDYDSAATIRAYMADTDAVGRGNQRLDEHDLRIPPRLYELLEDPAFVEARRDLRYSVMYDMIFAKAMELAGGDVAEALFVSLLATDLRERGPAGAVHGRRGSLLVPRSIFDNEQPESSVVGNRFDAAQHFFGYALLAYSNGGDIAGLYSGVSKLELGNRFGRFFRNLHGGRDPDFGADTDFVVPGPSTFSLGTDMRLRPGYDRDADLHYNALGIAFGSALRRGATPRPSSIINDPAHESVLVAIGAPADRSEPWTSRPDEVRLGGRVEGLVAAAGRVRVGIAFTTTRRKLGDSRAILRFSPSVTVPTEHVPDLALTPILDGAPRPDLVAEARFAVFALHDNPESRRFIEAGEQRFLVNHRGRRYDLTTRNSGVVVMDPDAAVIDP